MAGNQIHIKHVLAVVDVGHAEVNLQVDVLSEEELAFHINVEAVISGQTTLVQIAVKHTQLAIGGGVVEVDAVLERIILIEALHLCKGESAAEVPTSAELPFAFGTRRVGLNLIDVVAGVDTRPIHTSACPHTSRKHQNRRHRLFLW